MTRGELVIAMTGAAVSYDVLPYQMGTPEYDRLKTVRLEDVDEFGSNLRWILDRQAAEDFVNFWHIRGT